MAGHLQRVGAEGANRRKYTRVGTDQLISFAPVDSRDQLGLAVDFSLGGIRFETVGCEIHPGEVLRIAFNVRDHTVVAVGRVVWATEVDAFVTDVGLEFVEIDPLSRRLLEEETRSQAEGASRGTA